MAESLRVLGVDPGSFRTGWGLVGGTAQEPSLIECGVILLPRRGAFPDRLHRLLVEFGSLVARLAPTRAAVEAPFHGVNARAALQLAHARGVVLAVLGAAAVPVTEYAPATVKMAVTGAGRADKEQVRTMVKRLLGRDWDGSGFADESDALAVALCHLVTLRYRDAISGGAKRRR
jgi:crossover junction endodeoxyribonuclease RuvC